MNCANHLSLDIVDIVHYTDIAMKKWTPEEIKEFRKAYNLTGRVLCKLLGVTQSSIWKWQKGVRQPSKSAQILLDKLEEELQMKGGESHGNRNIQKK